MTRYHATPEGNVAFTAEEETARDAEEATWADGADARKMAEIRTTAQCQMHVSHIA